jgi:hypothetical protein
VKALVASIATLAITLLAAPAMAYVVVVTTSIPMTSLSDEAELKTAVSSAVDDVLAHAIGFTPTVVTLEGVRVVGDRIHLLLIVADADGEKSIEGLTPDEEHSTDPGAPATATDRLTL